MLKVKIIFFIIICFLFTDDFAIAENNSQQKDEDQTVLVAQSRKKKVRRKKRPTKRRKKKKGMRPQPRERVMEKSTRSFKKGFYADGGLQYYMPSKIDFMPAIEAGSKNLTVSRADIIHTGGAGINLGAGYRMYKNLAFQLDLFLVYPVVGSEMSLERIESNILNEGVSDGVKVVIPRFFVKGIYPLPTMPIDLFVGAAIGYTQLIKTVPVENEGIALAGMSYHATLGAKYEWNSQISIGSSFEYIMASYSYVDIWEEALYDSKTNDSVSLKQTIMIFGINGTYTF